MTYVIAEPCIDIKDKSCVDVCPEECIDCGACEPECPVEAIFPEDALPDKWEPFARIDAAFNQGLDVVNRMVEEYATEHNVQNEPIN
jgi:ferredoxin